VFAEVVGPAEVKKKHAEKAKAAAVFQVALLGRSIPVLSTEEGLRALGKDQKPVSPESIERYRRSTADRGFRSRPAFRNGILTAEFRLAAVGADSPQGRSREPAGPDRRFEVPIRKPTHRQETGPPHENYRLVLPHG
jgi:hypothetical protein